MTNYVDLDSDKFFRFYIFHPRHKTLDEEDRIIALIASIALGILTLGICHLVCKIIAIRVKKIKSKTKPKADPIPLPPPPPPKKPLDPFVGKLANLTIDVREVENICELDVDVIVNAANKKLLPGSGVCGAICKAAGMGIFDECEEYLKKLEIKKVKEGNVVLTTGGNLKAKLVIHAVGPRIGKDKPTSTQKDSLYDAYYKSLEIADESNMESIAFPSISTGIFNYPLEEAAEIAMTAFRNFAAKKPNTSVQRVIMAVWRKEAKVYGAILQNKLTESRLLDFYRGTGTDIEGRTIDEIWGWDDDTKERKHNFIQWLFPNKVASSVNSKAPILSDELISVMKSDPVILKNVRKSFEVMLRFYGLKYVNNKVGVEDTDKITEWCKPSNHNLLRITRMLKCLMALGLKAEAEAFFAMLTQIKDAYEEGKYEFSQKSYDLWRNAVNE